MTTIEIHLSRVFLSRIRRTIPAGWKDLSHVRRFSLFRTLLQQEGLSGNLEAMRKLLRLRRRTWTRISSETKADLLDAAPWLKASPSAHPVFPSMQIGCTRYHMPDSNFLNGSCMEFALSDEYLTAFLAGDESALPHLTAVLLREEDLDRAEAIRREDLRVRLHGRMEVENRVQRQRKLPKEVHIASLLYFAGVKILIARLYGDFLFSKPEEPDTTLDGQPTQPEQPASKPDPLGWWGLYMDSADSDVLKLDAIQQFNFHNFCTMEVRRRKHAREAEMRMRMGSGDWGKD